MKEYVTIQEAIRITGTSDSTVRRWLRSLTVQEHTVTVKREGRRLLIKRSKLLQSFKALNIEEADIVPAQRHQGPNLQQLLNRQADQIEQLLNENAKKEEDLRSAWQLILNLEKQAAQLKADLKQLTAGPAPDSAERLRYVAIIVLGFAALASFLYLILTA